MSQITEKKGGFRGWWKRNSKKIGGIVAAFVTGGPVAGLIAAAATIGSDWSRVGVVDYDFGLNSHEENILDGWVDNQFLPFYNSIITLVDGSILDGRGSGSSIIIKNINTARLQIATIREFMRQSVGGNKPVMYSDRMVNARNQFIKTHIEEIESAINAYIKSKGIIETANTKQRSITTITNTFGMRYNWSSRNTVITYQELSSRDVNVDLSSHPVKVVPQVVVGTTTVGDGLPYGDNTGIIPIVSSPNADVVAVADNYITIDPVTVNDYATADVDQQPHVVQHPTAQTSKKSGYNWWGIASAIGVGVLISKYVKIPALGKE